MENLHMFEEFTSGVVNWNEEKYKEWIDSVSWFEGDDMPSDFGLEMALNAENENGLIAYVAKKIKEAGGDETPLERIQWDIEANL